MLLNLTEGGPPVQKTVGPKLRGVSFILKAYPLLLYNFNNNMNFKHLLKNTTALTLTFGVFSLVRNMKNQEEINKKLDKIESLIQETRVLRDSLDNVITSTPEKDNAIPQETFNNLVESSKDISEKITELHKIESSINPENPTTEQMSIFDSISENLNKGLVHINDQYSNIIDFITKSSGGKGGFANMLLELNPIETINNFYSSLSMLETLAVVHLSSSVLILLSLTSIISIFYGEVIIKKLRLEEKFPKLVKIIELRRKFQQFYLWINILTIFVVILVVSYVNILILTN